MAGDQERYRVQRQAFSDVSICTTPTCIDSERARFVNELLRYLRPRPTKVRQVADMVTPEYVAEMARYNEWQNDVVYGLCDRLPDAERTRDRGMYFASLHRTLNHIARHIDEYLLDTLITGTAPSFRSGRNGLQ
jgi:hypothetical protein